MDKIEGCSNVPFNNNTVRPFTRAGIEAINPNQIGVYGLFKPKVWVYIGRGDIRDRLLKHLNGDNPCITREAPTSWIAEVTSNDVQRERELIAELNSVCNRRVG